MTERMPAEPPNEEKAAILRARGLACSLGGRAVLSDVDLDLGRGEVLGLIGPNGSGKTTLLRLLAGALRPDAGAVQLEGADLAGIPTRLLARRIAVVAQEPPTEVELSVAEVALLGRLPHRRPFSRRRAEERIAAGALDRVGMLDAAQRDFRELSGGERQRVLIARALVQEPEVMLLDEPTNHLDVGYQHEILHLIAGLGMSVVVVLHDLNLAARYADRLQLLHEGRALLTGRPEEVLGADILDRVYGIAADRAVADDAVAQLLFRRREVSSREDSR